MVSVVFVAADRYGVLSTTQQAGVESVQSIIRLAAVVIEDTEDVHHHRLRFRRRKPRLLYFILWLFVDSCLRMDVNVAVIGIVNVLVDNCECCRNRRHRRTKSTKRLRR